VTVELRRFQRPFGWSQSNFLRGFDETTRLRLPYQCGNNSTANGTSSGHEWPISCWLVIPWRKRPARTGEVQQGVIKSYARPGGNVTGIMPYVAGLPTKQLELARELVPGATRIGLLDDVTDPKAIPESREIKAAGEKLEITIIPAEVRTAADIGQAYETFSAGDAEIVVVEHSAMLLNASPIIAEAAAAKRLPTLYSYHEHVEAGGLISYGVNLDWCFHRAAYYVDRILKGTKPADLPVEFPTTLELWINQKTAKALGLKIPPTLLVRADKIIE
jgi:putative tryptophan/tyrosine transport system substrate-binding protein